MKLQNIICGLTNVGNTGDSVSKLPFLTTATLANEFDENDFNMLGVLIVFELLICNLSH